MLSWRVGAVKVTRVVEIEIPIAYRAERPFLKGATPEALRAIPWLFPHFVTDDGSIRLSIHALLVEAPGLRLVVDTCLGNDKPRKLMPEPLATDFLRQLESAGWKREAVDAVVCTHLHVDHVGWNTMLENGKWVPTFPKARYLIGRRELEHWTAEGNEEQQQILADSVRPIFDAGLAELVDPDYRISPEVRLIPTAGHTPGHVSVMIESQGERAVITGDMSHHPCQMVHPDWCPEVDCDPAAATAMRRRMFAEWADQPILVIGTHYAGPTAGHVRRDGEVYRFEV
ncbi:MAG: MBL fold metallo-hydrolase [Caulobacteraceae bacterium]|nr:MBL fold metallo-hydrolase [Caulobacteraceae bacterium]